MDALGGPSSVGKTGQVVVPRPVLNALIAAGISEPVAFVFLATDDDPLAVTMIPLEVFIRRYQRGASTERLERLARRAPREQEPAQGESP